MGLQSRGRLSHWISRTKEGPYARLAKGVESLDDDKSPQTREFTWIDDSSDNNTSGFQESWSVSGYLYEGDPASELLHGMAWTNAKNDEAVLYHVIVRHWLPENGQSSAFDAKRFEASFAPENEGGGAGGDNVTFSGTVNAKGDPEFGVFDIAAGIFTAR